MFTVASADLAGRRGTCQTSDPAAWDEALAADRPVVLEVKTDPEVPPLPPHITFQQAVHFSEALLKGDPHEGGVIRNTARQLLGALLPAGK